MTKIMKSIRENVIHADTISRKGNVVTFRKSFFYTMGGTAESYANTIENELRMLGIRCNVIDKGQVWKAFRGGASVAKQSHWWVKVEVRP